MKKLVEIVKNETVECLRVADPKLARKLTTLEKKMELCASAAYEPEKCIEMAFFAVLELFFLDLVIEKKEGRPGIYDRYAVTFTHGSIDDIEILIDFSAA